MFFFKGQLYESGGKYKKSKFGRRVEENFETQFDEVQELADEYFAEGADYYINEKGETLFYVLTYRERKIIEFSEDLKKQKEIVIDNRIREGWGLTHDPEVNNGIYYISDGSENIFECDVKQDFKILRIHKVS